MCKIKKNELDVDKNVFGFYIIIGLHGGCIGAFFFWKLFTFESDIFLIGVQTEKCARSRLDVKKCMLCWVWIIDERNVTAF